jgi:hypothetical protein
MASPSVSRAVPPAVDSVTGATSALPFCLGFTPCHIPRAPQPPISNRALPPGKRNRRW